MLSELEECVDGGPQKRVALRETIASQPLGVTTPIAARGVGWRTLGFRDRSTREPVTAKSPPPSLLALRSNVTPASAHAD
jgi:hypothetical protein